MINIFLYGLLTAVDIFSFLRTQIDQRLKPILKQVFAEADKDQNGVLSEEESILFFKSLGGGKTYWRKPQQAAKWSVGPLLFQELCG